MAARRCEEHIEATYEQGTDKASWEFVLGARGRARRWTWSRAAHGALHSGTQTLVTLWTLLDTPGGLTAPTGTAAPAPPAPPARP
eukprot:2365683-Pyramimonas_sp.AAC.1